eukprot:TRINITY_DN3310_c1_g1_i1.p1 TRINITY_DN3310_c1_g1~~TRINITY_DN3310_c1_g1_i1.p1  ORF type:complete len:447 (+),score=75.07 TRINITY_DN3310_c1_g1_i1:167-1507(+)
MVALLFFVLTAVTPFISALIPLYVFKNGIHPRSMQVILGLSAGLLLAIATLDLIPEAVDVVHSEMVDDEDHECLLSDVQGSLSGGGGGAETANQMPVGGRGTVEELAKTNREDDIDHLSRTSRNGGREGRDEAAMRADGYGIASNGGAAVLGRPLKTVGGEEEMDVDREKNDIAITYLGQFRASAQRVVAGTVVKNEGERARDEEVDEQEDEAIDMVDMESDDDHGSGAQIAMLGVGAGFFSLLLLEKAMLHFGAGHSHSHSNPHRSAKKSKVALSTAACMGMFVHGVVDGLVIAGAFEASRAMGIRVAVAIIMHKFPDGLVLSTFLIHPDVVSAGGNIFHRRALWLGATSLATPIGIILGAIGLHGLSPRALSVVLGFGAGSFLYITCVGILPDLLHPKPEEEILTSSKKDQRVSRTPTGWTGIICTFLGYGLFCVSHSYLNAHH